MFMKSASFADLVTCLSGDQPPRVWSLLVTVFGELARAPDARISGALLRHLSDLIGFKPEAVRVALHRLRKDGWIESQRHGRNSDYGLTTWGRDQSAAASPRIYATAQLAQTAWLSIHEPGQAQHDTNAEGTWITPTLFLAPARGADATVLSVEIPPTSTLPDWMVRRLCDDATIARARALSDVLDLIAAQHDLPSRLGPCELAVLRVLIVHDWRRIALKTPVLPDHIYPPQWPVPRCRDKVAAALRQIPRQTIDVLEGSLKDQ